MPFPTPRRTGGGDVVTHSQKSNLASWPGFGGAAVTRNDLSFYLAALGTDYTTVIQLSGNVASLTLLFFFFLRLIFSVFIIQGDISMKEHDRSHSIQDPPQSRPSLASIVFLLALYTYKLLDIRLPSKGIQRIARCRALAPLSGRGSIRGPTEYSGDIFLSPEKSVGGV